MKKKYLAALMVAALSVGSLGTVAAFAETETATEAASEITDAQLESELEIIGAEDMVTFLSENIEWINSDSTKTYVFGEDMTVEAFDGEDAVAGTYTVEASGTQNVYLLTLTLGDSDEKYMISDVDLDAEAETESESESESLEMIEDSYVPVVFFYTYNEDGTVGDYVDEYISTFLAEEDAIIEEVDSETAADTTEEVTTEAVSE